MSDAQLPKGGAHHAPSAPTAQPERRSSGAALLAEHVATVLRSEIAADRRRRPDVAFPPDMQGACWCASLLLSLAFIVHGYSPVIAHNAGFGHTWVEVNGYTVDITATQFGFVDHAVILRGLFVPWQQFTFGEVVSRIRDERSNPWHPSWHFDMITRALARALDVDLDLAMWTTLAISGPPYMAPGFPLAVEWKRLSAAVRKHGVAGGAQ